MLGRTFVGLRVGAGENLFKNRVVHLAQDHLDFWVRKEDSTVPSDKTYLAWLVSLRTESDLRLCALQSALEKKFRPHPHHSEGSVHWLRSSSYS